MIIRAWVNFESTKSIVRKSRKMAERSILRIALITPPTPTSKDYYEEDLAPPLGLGYIKSFLDSQTDEQEREVRIYDFINYGTIEYCIRELFCRYIPDVVGISLSSVDYVRKGHFSKLVDNIKLGNPNAKIVVGGYLATYMSAALLKREPRIDYTVKGEGEAAFLQLVRSWQACNSADQKTRIRYLPVITKHIRPPSRAVSNVRMIYSHKEVPVFESRGCPYAKCKFCGINKQYKQFSVDHVFQEVVKLHGAYKSECPNLNFYSDYFILNSRSLEIVSKIRDNGINWPIIVQTRCSSVITKSKELLQKFKELDVRIILGAENFDDTVLQRWGKEERCQNFSREAIERLSNLEMLQTYYIIFGDEYSTQSEVLNNLQAARETILYTKIYVFRVMLLTPGSDLFYDYEGRNPESDPFDLIEDYQRCLPFGLQNTERIVYEISPYLRELYLKTRDETHRPISSIIKKYSPLFADAFSRLVLKSWHSINGTFVDEFTREVINITHLIENEKSH